MENIRKIQKHLEYILSDFTIQYYSEKTKYFLTDYKNNYYILVVIPEKILEEQKIENDLKYIKAFSKLCIIFDANDYPKNDKRILVLYKNEYLDLNYEQWKYVVENLNEFIEK